MADKFILGFPISEKTASSVMFQDGTNVGIGTDSPLSILHAKGGSIATPSSASDFITNATARLVVNHSNEYGAYIGYLNSTNDATGIQSSKSNGVTTPLSLNPYGGNVGIGTDSPAEKLDVAGAIMSTGGITGHGANRTTISQEGANGAFWQSYGADSSTYGTFTLRQASSDFSLVRTPLIIDSSQNATFTGSVTTGSILTIKGASPYVQWINAAGTRLGYIQHNATDLIYNADTGIHKFNQNSTFAGDVSATGNLNTSRTIKVQNLNSGTIAQARFVAESDSGNIQLKAVSSTNSTYGTTDCGVINCDTMSGGLKFAHNDVTRMLIDSSGFVTIKNAPSTTDASLTLQNQTEISVNETVGYLNFSSTDTSTSSSGGVGGIGVFGEEAFNTSFTPTYMSFYTHERTNNDGTVRGNVTERMRITSAGILEKSGNNTSARILPANDGQGYIGESAKRWNALYATNGTIQTSDVREKEEIKPTQLGLNFVNDLNPVSYKWIDNERLDAGKDKRNHQGLIAQEVAKTLEKHGVDKNEFGGLDIQKTDKYDDFHGMSYEQLLAPMIKAIQELKAEIELLKAR